MCNLILGMTSKRQSLFLSFRVRPPYPVGTFLKFCIEPVRDLEKIPRAAAQKGLIKIRIRVLF